MRSIRGRTLGLQGMPLLDHNWTEEQAQGLLDSLNLSRSGPNWKPEHLKRLCDWCESHGKDHKTIEGQFEFVAFELCNDHEAMGMALKLANTKQEAQRAVEPYVKLLREDREWFQKPYLRRT
jgi:hypothetical protein